MPKRKHPLDRDPGNPATWQQEVQPDAVIDPDDEEIDQVFAQFPQNEPCLELFRIHPQGGRPLFLENLTPSLFSFGYVTGRFGGGKYYARGKYKDGSRVRLPFEIEGDPFPVKRVVPIEATASVSGQPPPVLGFSEPIQIHGEGNQALVSIMRSLIHEMRNSEQQFLEKMKLYKELFAPPPRTEAPLDTALNMFQRGVEMAGAVGGEGGISPWLLVLRELKEPLGKIVETVQLAMKQPAKPAPVGVAPVIPKLPGATDTAPEPQPSGQNMMMLQFKAILPLLINGATKNTEPGLYVDFILDQMPESAYPQLKDWLSTPGCLDQLAAMEPGIRFQTEWWNELRNGLLIELSGGPEPHAIRPIHARQNQDPPTEPATDHNEVS